MAKTNVSVSSINTNSASRQFTDNYENSFHCSNDQIHTPIYVEKVPTNKPGLEEPEGEHIGPTSTTLNPYYTLGVNMDYSTVCHDSDPKNLSPAKKQYKDIGQFRTMGLKGPILLSGFGYDLCDQPVPGDGNGEFDKEVAQNRTLYKSGPVDLKWDDERKVWAGGLHIVEGILTSNITAPSSSSSPTAFTVSVRRGQDWEDKGETITCLNRDISLAVDIGDNADILVMLVRINYEWRAFYIGCETANG
jgi:hypothetical protein